jgi:hypothetical protein
MKRDIIFTLISLLVFFLIASFVMASLNPFAWHWIARLVFVVSYLAFIIWAYEK